MQRIIAQFLCCTLVLGASFLTPVANAQIRATVPDGANYLQHLGIQTFWEDYIQTKKGKPVDLIFIGDSITQQWRWGCGKPIWQRYYADRALDFGVGGDTTQNALWRLENLDIRGFHPKVAVILIGTNNFEPVYTPKEIAAGVNAVIDKTQTLFPGVKVVLVSILPNTRANEKMMAVNAIIRNFADNHSVYYLDLAAKLAPQRDNWRSFQPDRLHLTREGYQTWAMELNALLPKVMGEWN